MPKIIAKTKRGAEWEAFAEKVLIHIDTYTVPQYGDKGKDQVSEWNEEACIFAIKKYLARFGRNSRKGQETMDMLKIAHYACLIYNKLKGNKNESDYSIGE